MVVLHNILEQVDLESAGFSKNKLASKNLQPDRDQFDEMHT
jgi:hypothetical protein